MRKFYIFNINKNMCILAKDSPYMLYKSFEAIYKSNREDVGMAQNLYEQMTLRINQTMINNKIYADNKDKSEEEKLTVKNSYLLCEGNTSKPYLLKSLTNYNFFVCDFDNKDYFWLDEICI